MDLVTIFDLFVFGDLTPEHGILELQILARIAKNVRERESGEAANATLKQNMNTETQDRGRFPS